MKGQNHDSALYYLQAFDELKLTPSILTDLLFQLRTDLDLVFGLPPVFKQYELVGLDEGHVGVLGGQQRQQRAAARAAASRAPHAVHQRRRARRRLPLQHPLHLGDVHASANEIHTFYTHITRKNAETYFCFPSANYNYYVKGKTNKKKITKMKVSMTHDRCGGPADVR